MRKLPTQVVNTGLISAALTALVALSGCSGGARATAPPAPTAAPANTPYPGLEEALAGAGLDPLGPPLNTGTLKSRAPALHTGDLPWFKAISSETMAGPRFGAELVRKLDRAIAGEQPVNGALKVVAGLLAAPGSQGNPGGTHASPEIPASVPEDMRAALTPILVALARVNAADADTPRLLQAAIKLAAAVEQADLGRFAGREVKAWWHAPGLGKVIIAGPGDDTHAYPTPRTLGDSVAFLLDTGGADQYKMPAGANTDGESKASVHVDLGGDDAYVTTKGGQGAGSNGVGLLWDLGKGADTYQASAGAQGSGARGVGVLLDDGGDDTYKGERGSQGAGMDGVGLLLDLGGNDRYDTFTRSQGFGGPGGVGVLYDLSGNDSYRADPGDPGQGGKLRFPAPQLPERGTASMSQGAGVGERDDKGRHHRTGGVGLLRDRAGDDSYMAGVFAQGAAYWFALGMLFDDAGRDQYDALWYGQGAAAHFALALLREGGGGDRYNKRLKPASSSLGLGHDLAVGWHLDLGGDDHYRAPPLSLGVSSSEGAGIMYNRGGKDEYTGPSPGAGDGASWGEARGIGVDVP